MQEASLASYNVIPCQMNQNFKGWDMNISGQGFPQVLRTWGSCNPPPPRLQNLLGGGGGGSMHDRTIGGELKMLSKNTFEGVHLLVKLPTISLQIY